MRARLRISGSFSAILQRPSAFVISTTALPPSHMFSYRAREHRRRRAAHATALVCSMPTLCAVLAMPPSFVIRKYCYTTYHLPQLPGFHARQKRGLLACSIHEQAECSPYTPHLHSLPSWEHTFGAIINVIMVDIIYYSRICIYACL